MPPKSTLIYYSSLWKYSYLLQFSLKVLLSNLYHLKVLLSTPQFPLKVLLSTSVPPESTPIYSSSPWKYSFLPLYPLNVLSTPVPLESTPIYPLKLLQSTSVPPKRTSIYSSSPWKHSCLLQFPLKVLLSTPVPSESTSIYSSSPWKYCYSFTIYLVNGIVK